MDPPPITTTATKLRLMCSYGGHIVPRLSTNSLCYAGGDTKIISVNPLIITTLSALTTLLASTLSVPFPFTLKYLLPPHHDLSSLIPLASDPDLLFFLHHLIRRLSSSSPSSSSSSTMSSRIRLFLFPPPVIHHPKTEVWFSDALKSAKIMQKVVVMGREGDGDGQSESFSGGELSNGAASNAESMVLESSSSFGSASSSASSSNLSSLKAQAEDAHGGANLQDIKVTLLSSDSFASDNSVTSAISHPQAATCLDPVVQVSFLEKGVPCKPPEPEAKVPPDSLSRIHSVAGCPLSLQSNQLQQKVQFVQVGANYIHQNPTGVLPISPCYQIYPAQSQQQFHYQPNQLFPVYFVPVGQMTPGDLPMQFGLVNTTTASNQHPIHANVSLISPQVAYNDATVTPAKPDLASQVYRNGHDNVAMPLVQSHYDQQQLMGIPEMHHQHQPTPIPSREPPNFRNELDDDPARIQIYKSQPPPP
ncbi:uncharacterized protein LOC108987935 [Juglans regia]|uniref:Uncharacterized protein LOC108987935 n=2 Tax=Juglans regia TaxID=51240 RepID=A0A2I4EAZ3_JUGRE|nr:uncharacterized protein LOC108987935 [Juglans regia]